MLSVDCGAEVNGWNGDAAISVVVGGREAGRHDLRLIAATEASLYAGIAAMRVGRLYAIGEAVEASIDARRARRSHLRHRRRVRRPWHRHRDAHGSPDPELRGRGVGPKAPAGFTGAIEPMVTLGGTATKVLADDWTVMTADGTRACHWEHSVAVLPEGLWILTAIDGGQAALEASQGGIRPGRLTPPAPRPLGCRRGRAFVENA